MHPILFTLPFPGRNIIIAAYGMAIILAILTAMGLTMFLSKKSPFDKNDSLSYLLIIASCGMAGAFICGIILSLPELIQRHFSGFQPLLVSWGGILGGVSATAFIWKYWKIDLAAFADLCAPAYLLGIGIGRIGCFFGGCCYGKHTTSSCGVTFTDPIALASHATQPLIPVQLISAAALISCGIIFACLYWKRILTGGRLFAVSAMVYSVLRFSVEFIRDDPRVFFCGLSDGQLFSVLFFTAGAAILIRSYFKKRDA